MLKFMWNKLILTNIYMLFSSLAPGGFSAELTATVSCSSPGILNLVGEVPSWQGKLCKQP